MSLTGNVDKQNHNLDEELLERALQIMKKEGTISIFDLLPEYSWLMGKTYCNWVPPGTQQILEKRPTTKIVFLNGTSISSATDI